MNNGPLYNLALSLTDRLFGQVKDDHKNVCYKEIDKSQRFTIPLNEAIRIIIAILAILLHVFVKYLFCLVIIMLTRSSFGGLHGKSYL